MLRDGFFLNIAWVELAGCNLLGDVPKSIHQFCPTAVVDAHGQGHLGIVLGQLLGSLELLNH